MRYFDISNEEERPVICVDNEDNAWSFEDHASEYLVVGEIYHVESIEVHSWHTRVFLHEFPNHPFNSVAFSEVE